ncbi:acyl carrier protein [Carnobacterium divergens]|uniref:acyl carrier protein n=1 Tax=Carnobacterium divergens TaxID=2748 RepID=UPI000D43AA01|nr:phosphopantetheine-binding protein [Carnobacterium divergens]MCO6018456.1 phosphopantetheine-binding protein [Carnobacterium divergens]SPC38981.1 Acyl carrier protein [Carnobacterium divergens]
MSRFEQIKDVIATISSVDTKEIELGDSWKDIGIDSLRLVELIVALEDKFSIKIKDSELNPQNLNSVETIVELINKYMDKKEKK